MNDHAVETELPREVRYVLRARPEVVVTVPGEGIHRDPSTYRAQLFDLSQRGAKIVSAEPISQEQSIRLQMCVEKLGMNFYVAADVCWSEPGSNGDWVFGCSLDPGLPSAVFDELARDGQIDRRFDPRLHRRIEVDALWELRRDAAPVTLQDYSEGGFCVRTTQPGQTGERFHLRLSKPCDLLIIAKSIWQLKVVDGYLLGCTFLNPRDFERLDRAVRSV